MGAAPLADGLDQALCRGPDAVPRAVRGLPYSEPHDGPGVGRDGGRGDGLRSALVARDHKGAPVGDPGLFRGGGHAVLGQGEHGARAVRQVPHGGHRGQGEGLDGRQAQRAFEQALKVNPAYSEAALNLSVTGSTVHGALARQLVCSTESTCGV
mgnify:CR=1 FL=1